MDLPPGLVKCVIHHGKRGTCSSSKVVLKILCNMHFRRKEMPDLRKSFFVAHCVKMVHFSAQIVKKKEKKMSNHYTKRYGPIKTPLLTPL